MLIQPALNLQDCSAIIPPLVQQISDLNLFPITFYEPLNLQNQMCELCTILKKEFNTATFPFSNDFVQNEPKKAMVSHLVRTLL